MPTTSNFGWTTPADTDLVKDGAAAIRTLGNGIDTSLVDLKGGTTGQILSKASNTDLDYTWIDNDQGDITAVNVTSPITGGGTAGAVTVGIQDGTTAQKGAVQLEDSTSSTSTTKAATPNSVKSAYDLANAAIAKSTLNAKGDLISASADDTPSILTVGNNGETLVADSSASTGLRWQGNFAAGKNKVINGDFGIWQRGTSFSSVPFGSFYADRFLGGTDGTGVTRTVSQQSFTVGTAPVSGYESQYFLRVNQTVAGTGASYNVLDTRIEDVRTFAGQTITLSFWAKAAASTSVSTSIIQVFGSGGSSDVSTSAGSQTITTSWTRYTQTITLPTISGKTLGTGNFIVARWTLPANATFTFDIWGVQLEAGNTATAFQTATGTLAGELAACQRYYQVLATGVNKVIGTGSAYTSSQCDINIFFAEMRIAPSLVATSGTGYYKFVRNGGTDPFDSITLNGYTTTHSAMCYNNTEISSTAGNAGWVYNDNAAASVALNAEL